MQIGELALQVGLSPDTIRFYEKQGLLDSTHMTRRANTYRDYTEAAIERLQLIKRAKQLGFTLAEIRPTISAWESTSLTPEERERLFSDKLQQIDQHIAELERLKGYLSEKLAFLRADEDSKLADR